MPDQRSLIEQLMDLYDLAVENGLYDAADWLQDQAPRLAAEIRRNNAQGQQT